MSEKCKPRSLPRCTSMTSVTPGMSGLSSETWRRNLGFTQMWKFVLENKTFHDVSFVVGTQKTEIVALKSPLIIISPVFETLFQGKVEKRVYMPDVDAIAFDKFLQYAYTGHLEAELADAANLLYIAKKFDVHEVKEVCLQLLQADLSMSNAVTIFQAAKLLQDVELMKKASSFILQHFEIIIKSDDFFNFTEDNLGFFLCKNELEGEELDLFQASMKWAQEQCKRSSVETTSDNVKQFIQPLLRNIRFPLIDPKDFVLHVLPAQVLSPKDSHLLMQHFILSPNRRAELPPMIYCQKQRLVRKHVAHFYEGIHPTGECFGNGAWFTYSFKTNRSIEIVSIGGYGPTHEDMGIYKASIKLEQRDTNVLLGENTKMVNAFREQIFHIHFRKSIILQPDIFYKFSMRLQKGPLVTARGDIEKATVVVDCGDRGSVTFLFANTNGYCGQPAAIGFKLSSETESFETGEKRKSDKDDKMDNRESDSSL